MKSRFSGTFWVLLFVLAAAGVVFAAGGFQGEEHGETPDVVKRAWTAFLLAPIGAVIALIFAFIFYKQMKGASEGNEKMQKIAGHVKVGAMAYLWQQYKVVGIVVIILSFMLGGLVLLGVQPGLVPFAFLTGAFFSGLCGYMGMRTATEASGRTAEGARQNLNAGLQIAFRSGAVMGLVVVGLALIDIVAWFWILVKLFNWNLHETTVTMLAFGMGASTQALFARVGGGIYTKAADVGGDLVGKVEAGIPEDDPRNPATIADNVGDNVGDVAGMGADLYESFAGSILATAAIGYAAANSLATKAGMGSLTHANEFHALPWIMLPMVIAGAGNILSIIGILAVRSKEDTSLKSLMAALFRGINLATVLVVVASLGAAIWLMGGSELLPEGENTHMFGVHKTILGIWISLVGGLIAGWVIGKATEYYTSNDYKPTQGVSEASKFGPATVIIEGTAVGMMSVAIPVISVCAAILIAFIFTGGFADGGLIQGLYGVSIAAVGMLSTLGITLATDAYGPIADNAGGNAQMAGLDPEVRDRTDSLDALGNTTAATGKGFAIGSAALTGLALMAAYMEEIKAGVARLVEAGAEIPAKWTAHMVEGQAIKDVSITQLVSIYEITIMNPKVLVGIFLGSMMAFVFCAMTMKAVGRAAGAMVEEVRRQFRDIPGIMEGKAEPDYASCVAIATKGAQREMIVPSMIAIAVPILVGLVLDIGGVLGLLAGTLSTGFVLAIMMAAAGGSWDNAKKWIEKGKLGGTGSEAHKATVIGDTVGDPFKDTSGPSLNILIKLMSMVSVVFVGLVILFGPKIASMLGM